MRIAKSEQVGRVRDKVMDELIGLMDVAVTNQKVCGSHCRIPCPSHHSITCGCGCSRSCPEIAEMLSSEGAAYPLERAVAPLVLELTRLRVFRPNWSCEGHNNPRGQLWKLPQVWFYCDSVLCVRLLAETVLNMKIKFGLAAHWGVTLSHSDADNPETTFSLEPILDPFAVGQPTLPQLHGDLAILAEHLYDQVLLRGCQLYADIR